MKNINVPIFLVGSFQDEQTGAQFGGMLDRFKNARALKIVERIRLTADEVVVTRHGPRGGESWSFNPYWLTIAVNEQPTGKGDIRLSSHGFSLSLGAFLQPAERREVADALRKALADMGRIS